MNSAAQLARDPLLRVTRRDRLFDATPYVSNQYLTMYDVARDGRFLMLRFDAVRPRTDVVIIRNWAQQSIARLDARAP